MPELATQLSLGACPVAMACEEQRLVCSLLWLFFFSAEISRKIHYGCQSVKRDFKHLKERAAVIKP